MFIKFKMPNAERTAWFINDTNAWEYIYKSAHTNTNRLWFQTKDAFNRHSRQIHENKTKTFITSLLRVASKTLLFFPNFPLSQNTAGISLWYGILLRWEYFTGHVTSYRCCHHSRHSFTEPKWCVNYKYIVVVSGGWELTNKCRPEIKLGCSNVSIRKGNVHLLPFQMKVDYRMQVSIGDRSNIKMAIGSKMIIKSQPTHDCQCHIVLKKLSK